VEEWQEIAGHMANLMPTFPPHRWRARDSQMFRIVKRDFPNHGLRAHDAYQAAYKVAEAYGSWNSNGRPGHDPRRAFGNGDYARLCGCCGGIQVYGNDEGFGVKVKLAPGDPEWFHVQSGRYQDRILNRVVSGEMGTGSGEPRLRGGDVYCHLSVNEEVEVLDPGGVDRWLGVDIGERVLWAGAVVEEGDVLAGHVEKGGEFRHIRERLTRRTNRLQEKGDLRGVRAISGERERYTDHVTHVASRRIVEMAEKWGAGIKFEKLTGYRGNAEDPIHDWPYAKLQEKVCYKATEAGIPAVFVPPHYTSQRCPAPGCGHVDEKNREGVKFVCVECGYENH